MIEDTKALQLARDAFRGSTDYFNANIRPQLERDLRQFQSRHGPDSKYLSDAYRSRAKFFRPKTRAMVRSNEATAAEAFFSTADVVSIEPQRETDDAQKVSAEINQELLQYRLTKTIPWFQLCLGAYQDAMVQGAVVSHHEWVWDPIRHIDEPRCTLIPLENIRFDPAADWTDPINTSPYLVWLIPMYVKDVKAKMREGKWKTLSDGDLKSSAKQYDSTRLLREDNRSSSTDTITAINDFTIVWVHLNVMADDELGADVMFYTLGEQYLLSSPVPLVQQYAHCGNGKRPFVLGKVVLETHKNWPSGKVRLARETQGEINEIANQRIDNVKFAMNKRYFVARGRQVDLRSLTRNVPSAVTLMNDIEKDVKVIDTPDVTSSSYQEQDRLNMDFDEITGNMSQSSVQANRRLNETVGGMEILSGDSNKTQAYDLKVFIETWVVPALEQHVRLEQHYETNEVILAIAAEKSKLYQKFGYDQITDELLMADLTLSVNVGMNATSPTQKINNLLTGVNGVKEALADGVLQQYGVDPQEIIKEVFGALGHPEGGRFFKTEDGDPQVTAMQQQIQTLQQQLEAKQPQALVDAQVREIEARIEYLKAQTVEKGTTSIFSAMQAGEVLASVPQVAPIADKIMQAAGYQVPSPAGVDPNFPVSEAAIPAAQAGPIDIQESGNTSPQFPARPDTGMNQGIEGGGDNF
jgi:hypothetical protein